jgi:multiple sugar transport system permease protein
MARKKAPNAYRPPLGRVAASVLKYASLALASAITILPLLTIFFGSMKGNLEFANSGPFDLPKNILDFSNYATAFTKGKMLLGFGNTFILVLLSAVGAVFTGTMSAYVLHRFEFKLKKP